VVFRMEQAHRRCMPLHCVVIQSASSYCCKLEHNQMQRTTKAVLSLSLARARALSLPPSILTKTIYYSRTTTLCSRWRSQIVGETAAGAERGRCRCARLGATFAAAFRRSSFACRRCRPTAVVWRRCWRY
jgi:hypothetical protein